MKRFFNLFVAFMTLTSLHTTAQEQRLLTMEEAVLGTGLAVENLPCTWRANGATYTTVEEGVIYDVNPKTGLKQELTTLEKINALLGKDLRPQLVVQRLGVYQHAVHVKEDALDHRFCIFQ